VKRKVKTVYFDSFKFNMYYDEPTVYFDDNDMTYKPVIGNENNLEKVFYGIRDPIEEIELNFFVNHEIKKKS